MRMSAPLSCLPISTELIIIKTLSLIRRELCHYSGLIYTVIMSLFFVAQIILWFCLSFYDIGPKQTVLKKQGD